MIPTFTGDLPPNELGVTLLHEHVFVGDRELDLNLPHPEWDEDAAVERAVEGLHRLHALGVRTVVDLTVPGLGRDVARVSRVAQRSPVRLVGATGYYTHDVLPPFFRLNGPGRLVDGEDPLLELLRRDIRHGIAGTDVRAGMIKVASDVAGLTPDVERVFRAAAVAHLETDVPLTTHSDGPSQGGLAQQQLLSALGVPLDRVVIGHAGDSADLDYLRRLADAGSYLGFDRFGMTHVAPDDQRLATLLQLLEEGYAERIVLSHDAAFFSRITPPSWRARTSPDWHMAHLFRAILPMLRAAGVAEQTIQTMMVDNPRRILAGAAGGQGVAQ